MMTGIRVGVLISGRGSNLQALIDACRAPDYPAEIACVISNNPGVLGLERAMQAGIAASVIDHRGFDGREPFEDALHQTLIAAGVELVCNAGFMRILTPNFVDRWHDRHLNIHPSLLPSFKGLHTHERALKAGVKISGCSVHFVRAKMDAGPIIVQAAVPVADDDTEETLAARVLKAEHRIYPLALRLVAEGRVSVVDGIARVRNGIVPDDGLFNPLGVS